MAATNEYTYGFKQASESLVDVCCSSLMQFDHLKLVQVFIEDALLLVKMVEQPRSFGVHQ